MSAKCAMCILVIIWPIIPASAQMTYLQDFDAPGYPDPPPGGHYWYFVGDIYPTQDDWTDFVPGDGYAYITVDPDLENDTDLSTPYQILGFGLVGEGHRLEARMKGALVNGGLVSFLFTYTQTGSIFNEVDIELVADDADTPPNPHQTYPCAGWTDGRFNTWRNADENTGEPSTWSSKPVTDLAGNLKSLLDDAFHTYTIDWRTDRIDFYIDGVLQESHTENIATGASEVIVGFRDLAWDGEFNWSGTRTLVLDYLKIEPLGDEPSAIFATNTRHANPGQTITFADQSPTATAWSWSFPGGSPSTASVQTVDVIYDSAGVYDVTLTATNTDGSRTTTMPGYVTIDYILPEIAGGNAGFEAGFNGWTKRQIGGDTNTVTALDSTQVICGEYAVHYGGAGTYEQLYTDINGLTEGNDYTLYFYAAGMAEADLFVGPCSDIYSGVYGYAHAGSTDYVLHTLDFTATDGVMRLWFDLYPGTESMYLDAFSFDNALCPARVLFVDSSATGNARGMTWSGALTSLADAVDLAWVYPAVDSILVAQGTYLPDTGIDRTESFALPDALTILGGFPAGGSALAGRDAGVYPTLLSGDIGVADDPSDNVYHVVTVGSESTGSLLDGVRIEDGNANGGGNDAQGAALSVAGGVHVRNTTIQHCQGGADGAIICSEGSGAYLLLEDCTVITGAGPNVPVASALGGEVRYDGEVVVRE